MAPDRGKRDLPWRNGIWGQALLLISLPLPHSRKPCCPPDPPRGSGENPSQVWMLWTGWFLADVGGKSQLCHLAAVGRWASDSTSLSPSFFICTMGIMITPCTFGTGEVPGSLSSCCWAAIVTPGTRKGMFGKETRVGFSGGHLALLLTSSVFLDK